MRRGGAFSQGLGAWEGGLELPHDHGPSLSRNDGCVLGWLRVAGFPFFSVITVPERFSCGTVTATKFLRRTAGRGKLNSCEK